MPLGIVRQRASFLDKHQWLPGKLSHVGIANIHFVNVLESGISREKT